MYKYSFGAGGELWCRLDGMVLDGDEQPVLAQGGEVWWRLDCMVLDGDEQPVNASASGWAACADTLSNGPR